VKRTNAYFITGGTGDDRMSIATKATAATAKIYQRRITPLSNEWRLPPEAGQQQPFDFDATSIAAALTL
jgi:hypothetical protein